MTERFANRAATTLDGGISNTATSLVVTAAAAFPNAGNFRILVDSGSAIEYMLVTGVSGSTFTVTRGIEGTTGVNHATGVQVVQVVTAGGLAQGIVDGLTTTPIAPTESSSASYSFPAGANTTVFLDTTANAITATLDPIPVNGEIQGIKDSGRALKTNPITVETGGADIEYPPGTVTTGPLVFGEESLGILVEWQWVSSQELWECLG